MEIVKGTRKAQERKQFQVGSMAKRSFKKKPQKLGKRKSVALYTSEVLKNLHLYVEKKGLFIYVLQTAKMTWQDETVSGRDIMWLKQATHNDLQEKNSESSMNMV